MGDHNHNHPGAEEEGGCPMSMLVSPLKNEYLRI